jgi:ABC-2 type transport system ATP-binding protein
MITITDLSFKYGREKLFSGLGLSLAGGGICGLLGKNGAGKTTLLKLMAGLRLPQSGDISVLGRSPSGRPLGFLQEVFFLPEVFGLPPVTPQMYEKLYAPFYPRFQKTVFREHLDAFQVPEGKKLTGISYGQKKKFLIAFGLATGCRVMLMDEPTNGLDISSKSTFRKAVAANISEEHLMIIATHQVRDLENLIDPVVVLDEGRIIFNQSMESISRRLKVSYEKDRPEENVPLFYEQRLGGYVSVNENDDGDISDMDLELLFNSVMGNRRRISRIFQEGDAA